MIQDPSPNEPEGRQLMVNKRLTKAISAVPRARFQKARPKLPSCKRNESNSTPLPLKSAVVNAEEINSVKEKLKSSEDILLLVSQSKEKCKPMDNNELVTELFETSKVHDASNFYENIPKKHVSSNADESIPKEPDATDPITESVKTTETSDISAVVNDEKFNSAKEKLKSSEDILLLVAQSEENHKPINNDKLATELLETSQNNLLTTKALNEEASKAEDDSNFRENTPKKHVSSNPDESISKEPDATDSITESVKTTKTSDILLTTTPVGEGNDLSTNATSTATTDRASKYPHLTSILSKKRAEPKKDSTHKRRRKYWKGDAVPERDKMTMADLIYWNPTNSDPGLKKSTPVIESASNSNDNIPEESHEVDEPEEEEEECSSVPKLVISEDGQINIDEFSLVVSRKKVSEPSIGQVMTNEETTYSSFRKRPLTKQWTPKDTFIFYKALTLVGTDFALMEKLLSHRTRRELKLKFKREEKYNIDLINKAMYESQPTFDGKDLEEHIANLNSVSEDFDLDCMQENSQPTVKEKKPRGRKRKEASKVLSDDGEQCLSPSQSIRDAGNKKPRGRKRKMVKLSSDTDSHFSPIKSVNGSGNEKPCGRKRKVVKVLSSDSDSHFSPVKSVNGSVSDEIENNVRNKRMKKKKKLPEGFVDIDDIEDITECIMQSSSMNDLVSEPNSLKAHNLGKDDPVKTYSNISVPYDESCLDKIYDESTNIQIICLEKGSAVEGSSSLVDDNTNELRTQAEVSVFSEKSTNIQIICLEEDNIEECFHLDGSSNKLLKTIVPSRESNNFQIVCVDEIDMKNSTSGETILVTDNASSIILPNQIKSVHEQPKNTSQTSINQNECVIDLIVDNANSNEIASFTHVMANEVVTSLEPVIKRKRKMNTVDQKYKKAKVIPKIYRKMNETKESFSQPLQLSSFNYTPLDDSLLVDTRLEFSPKSNCIAYSNSSIVDARLELTQKSNCRTYLNSNMVNTRLEVTPNSNSRTYSKSSTSPSMAQSILINSLEKPILTPEHSNSLLTSMSISKNSQPIAIPLTPEHSNSLLSSLNASKNQSLAIPLAPESDPDAPSDSVLVLTKSQNTDNVIHLFMYKNPSA